MMSSGLEALSISDEESSSALSPGMAVAMKNHEVEDIEKELVDECLLPHNELSWDILDLLQVNPEIDRRVFNKKLLNLTKPLSRTSFRFKRRGIEGHIEGYKEELRTSELDDANSGNSLLITRKFGSKSEVLKGKSNYLPFQPGGLLEKKGTVAKSETNFLHRNEMGLFDIPQGFSRGLDVGASAGSQEDVDDLVNVGAEREKNGKENGSGGEQANNSNRIVNMDNENESMAIESDDFLGLVPMNYSNIRDTLEKETRFKENWAHIVDLDHKLDNFEEVVPVMTRTWPFELDVFQKEAIVHLEQGDSVFISAHTSAGKTVIAEYAIAMATRNMTKAIYTSPIKALSNQKFRDFKETFKDVDVGLITGDVQINPEANCLIMTTEILRSMLYRGADLIRDVEFVIFDEVHYVNDIDRGVVWEEVIIMLPDHIKYILLSATVPNTYEFASWVGRTKQKDIYVISTPKRPVPLEIFIWAKNDLFKVVDSNRKFSEVEFKKHKEALEKNKKKDPPNVTMGYGSRGGRGGTARGGNRGGGGGGGRGGGNRGGGAAATRGRGNFNAGRSGLTRDGPSKNTWTTLVQYLKQHNLLPVVIFVFSKKKCEEFADTLKGVDFCNAKEKSEIHMFIDRAVSRLKKEDRELPQILKIRELLGRGIAVHHGGLLPIVKECIEILFARSLVKVLFATETFAMGLNLPTRTVVFNTYRKHDGRGFRNLLPGEFTQMSGRAGRRGLDTTGTVIIMSFNEPLSLMDFKEVTLGMPTKLLSQFRLTYNMILNLLRIEALRVEEMIKHSFSENSTQILLPEHQKTVEKLKEELSTLEVENGGEGNLQDAREGFDLLYECSEIYKQIIQEIQTLPLNKNVLSRIGRLMCFRDKNGVQRIGFFIKNDFTNEKLLVLTFDLGEEYEKDSAEFMLPWIPHSAYLSKFMKRMKFSGNLRVESLSPSDLTFIGKYIFKASIKQILQNNSEAISEAMDEISLVLRNQNRWHEVEFYESAHLSLYQLVEKRNSLLASIENFAPFSCDIFKHHYKQLYRQSSIKKEIVSLQRLISDENLELLPDYMQRLNVLESLGYIDHSHNVVLKGRVACEINSGWELIISELILDNFLGDFELEEIVALLSCFVYEGRSNEEEEPCVTPRLEKGKSRILAIAEKLMKVYILHQITLTSEEEEFLERKRFALVNVVYEWARGLSFNEIMKMSVEAEGTIVRVITRLDEICRQVKSAALIIGDSTLHSKMSDAQEKIKRDIVFCASLYL